MERIRVLIEDLQKDVRVPRALLRRAVRDTLQSERQRGPVEVSLVLVDDALIREMNRRYLGRDLPTDVLAFPMGEADSLPGVLQADGAARLPRLVQPPLLGDVVVSTTTARRQARRARHSVERELALLVLHGVLHLLGYDDTTPAAARVMRRRQRRILSALDRPVLPARSAGGVGP